MITLRWAWKSGNRVGSRSLSERFLLACVLLAPLAIASCQTSPPSLSVRTRPVNFQIMVNETITGLEHIKKIAVLGIVAKGTNQLLTQELGAQTSGLILSKLSESARYTLVERERVDEIMRKLGIMPDPSTLDMEGIKRIGQEAKADAVIRGDISTATRDIVVITFSLIDVNSIGVDKTKVLVAVQEKAELDSRRGNTIQRDLARMVERCVQSFVSRIAPCVSKQDRLFLEVGGETPGSPNQLGMLHAKTNLWHDSTNYFSLAMDAGTPRVVVLNNLAICQEYLGLMDQAGRNYQEAYGLSTNRWVMDNLIKHKILRNLIPTSLDRKSTPGEGQNSLNRSGAQQTQ